MAKTKKKTVKKAIKKVAKKSVKKPSAVKKNKKAPAKKANKQVAQKAWPVKTTKNQSLNLNTLISPLDDRLMVQLISEEKVTAGGIIIPDTANLSGQLKGVVVAVGRGHRDSHGRIRPMDVKVGDQVLLPEYAGDKVEVAGHQVQILRESDVLGVME